MSLEKYSDSINELVSVITESNVPAIQKGEFFGYAVDRLVHQYVQIPDAARIEASLAAHFPAGMRKQIEVHAGKLSTLIGSSDPMNMGEQMFQVIDEIWSRVGVVLNATPGFRVYTKGAIGRTLHRVQSTPDNALAEDAKERIMASRRRVMAIAVLYELVGKTSV